MNLAIKYPIHPPHTHTHPTHPIRCGVARSYMDILFPHYQNKNNHLMYQYDVKMTSWTWPTSKLPTYSDIYTYYIADIENSIKKVPNIGIWPIQYVTSFISYQGFQVQISAEAVYLRFFFQGCIHFFSYCMSVIKCLKWNPQTYLQNFGYSTDGQTEDPERRLPRKTEIQTDHADAILHTW